MTNITSVAQQVAPDGHDQANTNTNTNTNKNKSTASKSARVLTSAGASPTAAQLSPFAPQAPQFDYLVPINICITSQPVAQQPSLKDQPTVESISWALFNRASRRIEWSRWVKCSRDSPRGSLNDAIQQIDSSLAGKNFVLVTCGPTHLRQHLHPIAKRLQVELGPNYNQYTDLLKDFDRCTFNSGTIVGRQVGKNAAGSAPLPHQWQHQKQNYHNQQQQHRVTPCGNNCAGSFSGATPGNSCLPDNCCCSEQCCSTLDNTATVGHYGEVPTIEQAASGHCSTATATATATATMPALMNANEEESSREQNSERKASASADAKPANNCQNLRQSHAELMQQVSFSSRVGPEPSCNESMMTTTTTTSASVPLAEAAAPPAATKTCATCQAAPNEPLHCQPQANQPQSQPQQISTGTRKRFEEILKFLSINLDLSPGCSSRGTECAAKKLPSAQDNNQAETCNSDNEKCSSSNNNNNGGTRETTIGCEATKSTPSPSGSANCADCSLATGRRLVEAMCSTIERMLTEGHSFNRYERIKRRVEVGLCTVSTTEAEQRVVRARGLPWQASEQDIADFFIGLNIAKGGVGLCLSRQGRRNGEALIQFESREHRNLALSRHKHFMGARYIEVYRASGEDFLSVAAGYNNKAEAFLSRGAQAIMRMRGLPFTCTAKQVVDFFATNTAGTKQRGSCEVFAGEEGVLFVKNHEDKPTGDAFVLFAHEEHLKRALAKHHQNIGTRYVELFRSTVSEVQQVLSISVGPVGSGEQNGSAKSNGTGTNGVGPKLTQQPTGNGVASQLRQSRKTGAATSTAKTNATPTGDSSGQQLLTVVSTADGGNAFPALTERPVVWQRPEVATYAQVAHSRQQQQQQQQPQTTTSVQSGECATESGRASKDTKESAKITDQSVATGSANLQAAVSVQEGPNKRTKNDKSPKTKPSNLPKLKLKKDNSRGAQEELPPPPPTTTSGEVTSRDSQHQKEAPEGSQVANSQIDDGNLHEKQAAGHLTSPGSANKTPATVSPSGEDANLSLVSRGGDNAPASTGSSVITQSPISRDSRSSSLSTRGGSSSSGELSPPYSTETHYPTAALATEVASAAPVVASTSMAPPILYHQQYMAHPSMYNQHHQHHHHHHQPHAGASGRRHYHNNHYPSAGRSIASHRYHHQYHSMAYQPQPQPQQPPPPPHMHPPLIYGALQTQTDQMGAPIASAPSLHYPGQQQQQPSPLTTSSASGATPAATFTSVPTPSHPQSHYYSQMTPHQHQQQQHYAAAVAAATAAAADPALTSQRDCVRLRGLPFEAQIEDVLNFLGKHSENILYQGVHMVYSAQGQATGEAIIQMTSCQAAAATAQDAHRRVMSVGKKQRYIEVIPSSIDDMQPTLGYGLAVFAASRAAAAAAAAAYHHHHHHNQQQQQQQQHIHEHAPAQYYSGQSAAAAASVAEGAPQPGADQSAAMHYGQSGECSATSEHESTLKQSASPVSGSESEPHSQLDAVGGSNGAVKGEDPLDQCACNVPSEVETTSIDSGLSGADERILRDHQDKLDQQQCAPTAADSASSAPLSSPPPTSANIATPAALTPSEQQQQQAILAATAAAQAAAAAYYPILYYYPPQHQMLPAAGPARYH